MCEVFAICASQPVVIGPFLARLVFRGSKIGLHADGWSLRYGDGCASMTIKGNSDFN